jgi:predicted nucleotidyltransferase
MTTLEQLRARRDEIIRIAEARGIRNLRVFGSVARGDAVACSDVDFLVDVDPGRSLFDMGGVLMALRDLLECDVDLVEAAGLRERFRDRVLREAVPL